MKQDSYDPVKSVGTLIGAAGVGGVANQVSAIPLIPDIMEASGKGSNRGKITPEMKAVIDEFKRVYPGTKGTKVFPKGVTGGMNPALDMGAFIPNLPPWLKKLFEGLPEAGIYVNSKNPALLAHELGHSVDFKKFPATLMLARMGIPLAGITAGTALAGNEKYRKYAPWLIGGSIGAGIVMPEATASYRALKVLRNLHGNKIMLSKHLPKLLKAFGTYGALAGGAGLGAKYIGDWVAKSRR